MAKGRIYTTEGSAATLTIVALSSKTGGYLGKLLKVLADEGAFVTSSDEDNRGYAWFASAQIAVTAIADLVRQNSDDLSAVVHSEDIRDDVQRLHAIDRSIEILKRTDSGQLILTLSTVELVRRSLPDTVLLDDLGTIRVGRPTRAERLFSFRIHEGKQGNIVSEPKTRRRDRSWFFGRERELDELRGKLDQGQMITIVGGPGTGKSALASRFEAEIADQFSGGSVWVDLSRIELDSLIIARIAEGLELSASGGRSLYDAVVSALKGQPMLLVLDNCESAVSIGEIVDQLCSDCPDLLVLSTSQRRLRTNLELVVHLGPLEVPQDFEPAEIMIEYPSVRLFLLEGKTVDPDFELDSYNAPHVARICQLLDGNPQAIRMAVNKLQILSPEQIVLRLKDGQISSKKGEEDSLGLLKAIEATSELVHPAARILLRRLSVFRGPFSFDAAKSACVWGDFNEGDLVFSLRSLVELHLVEQWPGRSRNRYFYLSNTVRIFADEELRANKESEKQRTKYGAWAREFAEATGKEMNAGDSLALEKFDAMYEDVRAVLLHGLSHQKTAIDSANILMSCASYWFRKLYLRDGMIITEAALASKYTTKSPEYPRIINLASFLSSRLHDIEKSKFYAREAIRAAQALGQTSVIARAYNALGACYFEERRFRRAVRCFRYAACLHEQAGDAALTATVYSSIALCNAEIGRWTDALQAVQEAEDRSESIGHYMQLTIFQNSARVHLLCQNYRDSWRSLMRCLELFEPNSDPEHLTLCLSTAARVALAEKKQAVADALINAYGGMILAENLYLSERRQSLFNELRVLRSLDAPFHPVRTSEALNIFKSVVFDNY